MKHKRNLRKAIQAILKEDASRFEDMIKYASELDGDIRQDAAEFANKYEKDSDKIKDWYEAWKDAYDDEFKPFAEVMHSTFEDLPDYGKEDTKSPDFSGVDNIDDFMKLYLPALEKSKGKDSGWYKAGKDLKSTITDIVPAMTKGDPEKLERVLAGKDNIGGALGFKGSLKTIVFNFGEEDDKKSAWGALSKIIKPAEDSGDSTGEPPTVDEVEDELSEFNADFDELTATLEDTVEKAYKAKDTEEFKALEKSQKDMEKYLKFVNRLFETIINFAKKKERDDVVQNTQENVQVLLDWVDARGKQQEDVLKQVIEADPDFDSNPSQKSMKAIAKFFNSFTEDLKKIAIAIKKDPLKKMNKNNIMESVRKERKALMMEKALRAKIRSQLLRR